MEALVDRVPPAGELGSKEGPHGRGTTPARGPDQPPGAPGWVTTGLAVGLAVAVALVVLVMVLGGGQHGPGMHG